MQPRLNVRNRHSNERRRSDLAANKGDSWPQFPAESFLLFGSAGMPKPRCIIRFTSDFAMRSCAENLVPGQQVPSSRALAAELEISRFPCPRRVCATSCRGIFPKPEGRRHFCFSPLVHLRENGADCVPKSEGTRQASRRSSRYPHVECNPWRDGWGAFTVHQPALDRFPFETWSKLVARHSRTPRAHAIRQIDPLGLMPLRDAICSYLRTARAVRCDPEQIMIVSGSQQALDHHHSSPARCRRQSVDRRAVLPAGASGSGRLWMPRCARSRGRGRPRCCRRSQARAQCPGRFRHPVVPLPARRYHEHFKAAATARLGSKSFRLDCRERLR